MYKFIIILVALLLSSCGHTSKINKSLKNRDVASNQSGNFDRGQPLQEIIDSGNSFTIKNVQLFDGDIIHNQATVKIENGFITTVCSEKTKDQSCKSKPDDIDGNNQFLMPGLMDAEAHIVKPQEYASNFVKNKADDAPMYDDKKKNGCLLRPSVGWIYNAMANTNIEIEKDSPKMNLLVEKDTHGLYFGYGSSSFKGRQSGKYYPITEHSAMEKHLRFGVTTIFDMHSYNTQSNYYKRSRNKHFGGNTQLNIEDRDLRREFVLYPDSYSSGLWAIAPNLHYFLFGADPIYNLESEGGPWTTDDLSNWVKRRIGESADYIKVYYDDKGAPESGIKRPEIGMKTLKALTIEAHKSRLKVITHLTSDYELNEALGANIDGSIHSAYRNEPISDNIASAHAGKFNVPTLSVFTLACDSPYSIVRKSIRDKVFASDDVRPYVNAYDELRMLSCEEPWEGTESLDASMEFANAAKLASAGVPLLTGTDSAGAEPAIEGFSVHYEAYMISQALLLSKKYDKTSAHLEALRTMTSNPARAFGLTLPSEETKHGRQNRLTGDPRGFIRPGYRADMILVRESPMDNMLNTLKIAYIWKAGFKIDRQKVRNADIIKETKDLIDNTWNRQNANCQVIN